MRAACVDQAGQGAVTVVYVPGIDGSGEMLLGTAARVARRFRLLRLRYEHEPRPSTAADGGYGELAASVAACLEERGIERYLLLAESFGVAVALQTTLDHPARVAGMLLVNGFAHYDARARLALSALGARMVPAPIFRLGRRAGAIHVLFGPRRDDAAERAFRAAGGVPFDAGYRQRLAMIARLDLRPHLGEIAAPVALFASDADRIVRAVPAARVLAAGLRDATLEVLPRAGHVVLPMEREPWVERLEALARRAGLGAAL